jgi:hypothetical protein
MTECRSNAKHEGDGGTFATIGGIGYMRIRVFEEVKQHAVERAW